MYGVVQTHTFNKNETKFPDAQQFLYNLKSGFIFRLLKLYKVKNTAKGLFLLHHEPDRINFRYIRVARI